MSAYINKAASISLIIAVSMDLIGGRWAAYLLSPLPGVYLPDFFYLTAIFLIVCKWQNIKKMFDPDHIRLSLLCLIAIGYVAIKLILSRLYYQENFSYAMRDGALLFFLATAPLTALVLGSISSEKIMRVIKWSGLIYVSLFLLVFLGVIEPFNSPFIGNNHVRIFEFGGDLVGVVSGITYLFWSHSECNKKISNLAKILAIAPLVLINSRGGCIAMIIVIMLTLFFITHTRWKSEILIILIGFTVGCAMSIKDVESYMGVPVYSSSLNFSNMGQPDVVSSSGLVKFWRSSTALLKESPIRMEADKEPLIVNSEAYFKPLALPGQLQRFIEDSGTVSARLATWKIVIEYLIRKDMFIVGAPYGSKIMLVACSNPYLPTYGAPFPGGGSLRPKCPVDSNEAFSSVRDAHNFIVTLVTYNGLVGFFIFITLLFVQLRKSSSKAGDYRIYAVIALIGYCISGFFSTFSSYPFVMVPCAFLLGWLQSQGPSNG